MRTCRPPRERVNLPDHTMPKLSLEPLWRGCAVRVRPLLIGVLLLACGIPWAKAASGQPLRLQRGDRIAIIGNALPDRMQHNGHFETLIHAAHPDHELQVRTLAVSGDEVVIRHRSENFGSPDEWLRKVGATVVFAFFGFNESFAGPERLDVFRAELAAFIEETTSKD